MLQFLLALENLIVGANVHGEGFYCELEEFLLGVLDNRVQVPNAIYCLLRVRSDGINVLPFDGPVPTSRWLQNNLQQRVNGSVEVRKTVIHPDLCVVLYKRITVIEKVKHLEKP